MSVTIERPPRSTVRAGARRRRFARIDVAIGVALAILALIIAPGLAIIGIAALCALALCAISVPLQRRRTRRKQAI
jgi:Flp pilus assembly protein TadB